MKKEYSFYKVRGVMSDKVFFLAESEKTPDTVFYIAYTAQKRKGVESLLNGKEENTFIANNGELWQVKRFNNGLLGLRKDGVKTTDIIEYLIQVYSGDFGIMFNFPQSLRELKKKRNIPFNVSCLTKSEIESISLNP